MHVRRVILLVHLTPLCPVPGMSGQELVLQAGLTQIIEEGHREPMFQVVDPELRVRPLVSTPERMDPHETYRGGEWVRNRRGHSGPSTKPLDPMGNRRRPVRDRPRLRPKRRSRPPSNWVNTDPP